MPTLLRVNKQWHKLKMKDIFPKEQLNLKFMGHIGEVAEVLLNTDPFEVLETDELHDHEYTKEMFDAERVKMFAQGVDGLHDLPYYEWDEK